MDTLAHSPGFTSSEVLQNLRLTRHACMLRAAAITTKRGVGVAGPVRACYAACRRSSNTVISPTFINVDRAAPSRRPAPPNVHTDQRQQLEDLKEKQPDLQIERFHLPELSFCFPVSYHPDYKSIREEVNSWLLNWKCPKTEEERKTLVQTDFPGVICMSFPESLHADRVALVCKVAAWICCYDDASDEAQQEGADANGLNELNEGMVAALAGTADSKQDPFECVLTGIRATMTPEFQERYIEVFKRVLSSIAEQAALREKSSVPDLFTYIENRRKTVGFAYIQVMTEYCLGVELHEEILKLDTIKELHNAAADFIAWTNDLLSFRREYFEGDLQNLLPVLYFHYGGKMGFDEVVREVCRMIQQREREFVVLLHRISLSQVALDNAGLRQYLHNLPNLLGGHLEWYYTSARFHGIDHGVGEVRTGIVHMLEEKTVLLPY